jgi:hypothetical protein
MGIVGTLKAEPFTQIVKAGTAILLLLSGLSVSCLTPDRT